MAMFGRKTTECHQCEAWHKVKLVINGIAVIGGQCTQLVPAGDFCKDCDTNVTFPIYLEWRYSPQRDKFKLEREGSVVVIEDAEILLFSNAIKKAIEDNPFIGKDIIGTPGGSHRAPSAVSIQLRRNARPVSRRYKAHRRCPRLQEDLAADRRFHADQSGPADPASHHCADERADGRNIKEHPRDHDGHQGGCCGHVQVYQPLAFKSAGQSGLTW